MKADYVVTTYEEKKMGFLFEDQLLTEARFFSGVEQVGGICTATVSKIVPSVDGAFLDGPDGQVFFYPLRENVDSRILLRRRGEAAEKELRPGDCLPVQVTAEAQKKKQASVTSKLSLASDGVIVNLTGQVGVSKKIRDPKKREELQDLLREILSEQEEFQGFGAIARTAAEHFSWEQIKEVTIRLLCELRGLIQQAETTPEHKWLKKAGSRPEDVARLLAEKGIYEEVTVHTDLDWEITDEEQGKPRTKDSGFVRTTFGYQLHRMTVTQGSPLVIFNIPVLLEKALAKKVFLKSGGFLYVETTEAMTVIDVNSGKNIRERSHEEGALEQNLEAAREIARLLRLRNISGMIMIDFISMKKSQNEQAVMAELRKCSVNDSCRVNVVDITKLGIVEMTREKKSPPLSEQLDQQALC